MQSDIIAALGVAPTIDPDTEITRRVQFLVDYLDATGAKGYVLGISGGQDSTTCLFWALAPGPLGGGFERVEAVAKEIAEAAYAGDPDALATFDQSYADLAEVPLAEKDRWRRLSVARW